VLEKNSVAYTSWRWNSAAAAWPQTQIPYYIELPILTVPPKWVLRPMREFQSLPILKESGPGNMANSGGRANEAGLIEVMK